MSECEFCELNKKNNDEFLLAETEHWKIYLADEQNYPGRCIIPLKRHVSRLSELTREEWDDFHKVVCAVETALIAQLGSTNLNWTCLMNGGYAVEPSNPHVHFHLIPRYRNSITIGNQTFIDENFGDHYKVGNSWRVNMDGRNELVSVLSPAIKNELIKTRLQ